MCQLRRKVARNSASESYGKGRGDQYCSKSVQ
jgi:hypothetical protein